MGDEGLKSSVGVITSAALAAASADPGNQFGRYIRIAPLGSGQMADVFLGYDTTMRREVALKVLSRLGDEDRARLVREAQATTVLSHPNIVAVYEVGRAGPHDFIAMEYVRGVPLSRTGVSPSDAVRLVREAAAAVHQAHGQGILHRDIKPANLFVDDDRRVRVSDFGMARSTEADGRTVTGTPAYLAPEEARGSAGAADERIDVYALGATLYELATGEPPYRGATDGDVLQKVLREKPVPPRKVDPKVAPDLETIILKAMARDPSRRYGSAGELAEDLRRFLDREPIAARPGRGPALRIVSVTAAVLGVAAATWYFWPASTGNGGGGGGGGGTVTVPEKGRGDAEFQKARDFLEKADRARAEGSRATQVTHLKSAVERLDEALRAEPENGPSLLARARTRGELASVRGAWDAGAKDDVERLLKKEPTNAEGRFVRARLLYQEFERRQGGGMGAHLALRPIEGGQLPYTVVLRPRADLAAVKRAMQALHGRVKDDLEAAGSLGSGKAAYARSLGQFLRGSFDEAQRAARQAAEQDGHDEAAWALHLTALEAAGKFQEGAAAAEEALKRLLRNPTVLAHRSLCCLATQRATDAEQSADEAARAETQHAAAHALRAMMRSLRNDGRGANEQLGSILREGGADSVLLRWSRSVALRFAGRVDDALADLNWAVEQGGTPLLQYERGGAYGRKSDWAKALKDLEEAAREMPDFDVAALERAEAREMLQDFEGAARDYIAALQKSQDPVVRLTAGRSLALLMWARGQDAEAHKLMLDMAKAVPQNGALWQTALMCANADGDNDRYGEVVQAWLQADATNGPAHFYMAETHERRKEYDKALAELKLAEERQVQREDVLAARVNLHELMKNWEKALDDIESLITMGKGLGWRFRQVRAMLQLERWDNAESESKRIMGLLSEQQRPDRAALLVYDAMAAAGRGDLEEAMARLKKAVETSPIAHAMFTAEGPLQKLKDQAEFQQMAEAAQKREEDEKRGRMGKPFMGVNMGQPTGGKTGVVLLGTIKGTGARAAGLRPGDRLVRIDGVAVANMGELSSRIQARGVGDRIKLRIERDGPGGTSVFEREVKLVARPADK